MCSKPSFTSVINKTRSTTLAGGTTTVETWVYETSTSYCPVTEVSTISGQEVTVVYTSTSLIEVKVPTTIVEYTTALTTCYETTEVYTTESVCLYMRYSRSVKSYVTNMTYSAMRLSILLSAQAQLLCSRKHLPARLKSQMLIQ
jgi:hypothetical protein